VVNNSVFVLHGYEDAKPQRFWDHDLNLLGSRDVIGHILVILVVNDDHGSILHIFEIFVTILSIHNTTSMGLR